MTAVDTTKEYETNEPRPELPAGFAWREVVVESGRDTREYRTVYRAVRVATAADEAKNKIRELVGRPYNLGAARIEGGIPEGVVGEVYQTQRNGNPRSVFKVVLTDSAVWIELDNGSDGPAHWKLGAELIPQLNPLFEAANA